MKISSLILIALTVTACTALFINIGPIFGNSIDLSLSSPAKIEVMRFSGGDRYNDSARFEENLLLFKHAGGASLPVESVSVQIAGTGNAYCGIPGSGGSLIYGELIVFYEDVSRSKKSRDFEKHNAQMLQDGLWSAGEILVLSGNDSFNGSVSSVFVSVDGL